ncbi:uncharacterized protein EI97DRAFT_8670 [Westerdykella ornata]|uniref:Uncharacterized protein n=1 Tax=Westerdykella ornata TaxID=318751 RepID=A0A6A6JWM5_WESOR|nr:uncharacterized protein EI97DRAFT_8670 [Westerdykella ornata]KAF2280807.1 hypothetical protein EI97DRAFT_8670 [Westerdykella ornata]
MLMQRRTFFYLSCWLVNVVAQGPYPDGSFIFPPNLADDKDQSGFPTWTIGTLIYIQWNTSYERSNLFYSQFYDDDTAQLLAANTDKKEFAWTIRPSPIYTNLSMPFHFRVVNPRGTQKYQAGGGFWSSGVLDSSSDPKATAILHLYRPPPPRPRRIQPSQLVPHRLPPCRPIPQMSTQQLHLDFPGEPLPEP